MDVFASFFSSTTSRIRRVVKICDVVDLTATYHPSQKLSKLDEPDMRDAAGEVGTNSKVTYSCGPLHMDEQRRDDQLESIYNSYMPIQDVVLKTYQKRWTIEMCGGRGSGRSVLMVQHHDIYLCWDTHRDVGPVGWGCRIHQLHLCREVRLPQRVNWLWH